MMYNRRNPRSFGLLLVGLGTGGALLLATSSIVFFRKALLTRQLIKQKPESTLVAKRNQGEKEGMTMKIPSTLNSIAEVTKAIGVSVIAGVLTAHHAMKSCPAIVAQPSDSSLRSE